MNRRKNGEGRDKIKGIVYEHTLGGVVVRASDV